MQTKEDIHKEKVSTKNRTYFLDIKKSSKGDYYLKISEGKKNDKGEYEYFKILVFEEDAEKFADALNKTVTKLKELKSKKGKAYSNDTIREKHTEAYKPWTTENDNDLELLFCEGKSVKELATIFGRKAGAISSRIKKLELKEKYNH